MVSVSVWRRLVQEDDNFQTTDDLPSAYTADEEWDGHSPMGCANPKCEYAAEANQFELTPSFLKVYVLMISHRHGTNVYVGKSREEIDRELHQYVADEWSDMRGLHDEDMPEDWEKALAIYFEVMADTESFEITEHALHDVIRIDKA